MDSQYRTRWTHWSSFRRGIRDASTDSTLYVVVPLLIFVLLIFSQDESPPLPLESSYFSRFMIILLLFWLLPVPCFWFFLLTCFLLLSTHYPCLSSVLYSIFLINFCCRSSWLLISQTSWTFSPSIRINPSA